tara:strand:- start:75 stop:389 length:315 start_codon:yes stop_codon:yes gene_type:complete
MNTIMIMTKNKSTKDRLIGTTRSQAQDEGLDLEMSKERITTIPIKTDKDLKKDLLIPGVTEARGETDREKGKKKTAKGLKETEITERLKVVPREQAEEGDVARL